MELYGGTVSRNEDVVVLVCWPQLVLYRFM